MADTFTCAAGGGTFHKGWSDEEKVVEAEELFGHIPEAERITVCDDCFRAMERQRVAEGIPREAFRDGRDPFASFAHESIRVDGDAGVFMESLNRQDTAITAAILRACLVSPIDGQSVEMEQRDNAEGLRQIRGD